MHAALSYLLNYISTNWDTIGTYLLGGAGISLVVKFWDKFKGFKSGGWKQVAVGAVSGLSAITDWIINNYTSSPLAALGNIGARLFVSAVFMHRILVNPLVTLVEKNLVSTLADAKAYRAEQANGQPAGPEGF